MLAVIVDGFGRRLEWLFTIEKLITRGAFIPKESETLADTGTAHSQINGHVDSNAAADESTRRYVADLRVLNVSPSIKTTSGEPVWKLNVQFPWNGEPELTYLSMTEGVPAPKVGNNDAILQRGKRRSGTDTSDDSAFEWSVISLSPTSEKPQQVVNDKMPDIAPPKPVVETIDPASTETFSRQDAELRTHAALKASAEMVSGYLASENQSKREHTWRDMVELTTTVADAFLNWMDDATNRQLDQRPMPHAKPLEPKSACAPESPKHISNARSD